MKYILVGTVLILLLTGCSIFRSEERFNMAENLNSTNQIHEVELKDYGQAPELAQSIWLNTDVSLQISELMGKVVLIDFWTFG